jgi:hypothetical protein
MVYFQTKNIFIKIFWKEGKIRKYWYILWHFGRFYGYGYSLLSFGIVCCRLVYFVVFWYNFPRFSIVRQEKSGNPGDSVRLLSMLTSSV